MLHYYIFFFLMIRRPPRSTQSRSSAASDVYKRQVKEGAGAFVCGEETAMMASIEGSRGMPLPRPPFPANKGIWGMPTNINNVETFANVPWIMRNGAKKYASIGTA